MKKRNASVVSWIIKSLTSLMIVVSMLLPNGIFDTTQPVAAHNLDASAVYVFFDPDTQAMLDARIAGGWTPGTPLIQVGDEIGLVIKAVPDNGTTTGVGGYTTFYIPNGAQVIDAAFLIPGDAAADGITGYDKIPAKGQALMPNVGAGGGPTVDLTGISRGPNIAGVTANLVNAANVNNGTLPGVYGDLGIFYSTAPETAYGSYTNAPAANKKLTNNSGDTVGWRTPLQAPLNLWDVWQMAGFGINGTTDTSLPATPRVDSNGRGNTIWGNASAVAGPQSGYAWDFNLADYVSCAGSPTAAPSKACIDAATNQMGPWQRIKYPGSQIAYDIPGDTTLGKFAGGLDASNVGYALSPSNPLPATTSQTDNTSPKAIRFAYGQLTLNTPEFAWVKFKVNDFSAMLDPTGCPVWRVDTFGGDAGGDDNGKDHIWRYYDPNSVQLNGCLAVGKPATRDVVKVGDYYQYTLSLYNAGNTDLTNVVVTDQLPAGVTFVSAVPAQNSGPNPLRWVIGSLQKGQSWKAVVTVRASGTGVLLNTMTATGQSGSDTVTSTATERTVSGLVPYLRQTKSVNPPTAAPGGTVAYTIQIENIGTGATGTPIVITEYLPAGFTYEATPAPTARVNGAVVTPSVNATNPNKPIFTIPAALQAGQSLYLTFTAKIAASQAPGAYCNSYTSSTPVNQTTGALACVTVAGGKIGDFIWRDWDGDGMQNAGEEGIAGVKVYIDSNNNGSWESGEPYAITDANGAYYFPGLTAGTYVVRVDPTTLPANHTQTGDPDATKDNAHTVTLVTDQQYLTADFGYKPTGTASIGDKVFEDIANDGTFTSGVDSGIPNVTVWLYEDSNANGVIDAGDALVATTQTNSVGDYLFSNLAAGYNYLVKVDKNDADIQTYFNAKYGAGTPYQLSTAEVIASPNLSGADLDNDFGFWRSLPASIGDQLFVDANRNGMYDAGETPLANVTVTLYRDGLPVATTVSGPDGKYLFSNLGPGNYKVVVDTHDADLPAGLFATVTEYTKVLAAGENYLTADFPFVNGLTKTVDKAYATTGETLNFTLKPYYPGSGLLTNVRIIDPLPTGVTFGSANAGGTYGAYTPLPAVPGHDDGPPVLDTALSVSTNYVVKGGAVNVTLNVKSSVAATAVSPTPIEVSGGTATCTGPTPASANVPAGGTGVNFAWTCTLHDVGEYVFSAGAANATTSWPDASSASVLSSPGGGPNVVTWNLGSNAPGVPGETLISGFPAGVYAFRGGNTREFSKYTLSNNAWSAKAQPTNGIEKGGSLTVDPATHIIYALEGNSKWFYKYDIATNTWTRLADTAANVNEGGAAQYLSVGGTKYVYALLGGSNLFSRYNVASNTWTAMATTPANVKKGGALTTDGTNLYALQGDRKTGFWRYNVASNTWTALASTPGNVGWGGSLTYVGGYIYALQGDGKTGFWRYDIATNTWTAMAATPGAVADGGALTTDGTYIYALQGKTLAFWRYNPATNTWSTMTPANFTGNVGQGGALVYDAGVTPTGRFTTLTARPSLVSTGDSIKLTFRIESSTAVNDVTPGTLAQTATGGASASCGSPTLVSTDDDIANINDPVIYEWTCAVTPGTSPGSLTFSVNATGSGPTSFPTATSRRVIVSPVLTYQATVAAGAPAVIRNTGILAETSGAIGTLPSNTTETATSASIGDFVWADTDSDGVQDTGELGLAGVKVYVDSNANGVWDAGEPYDITDATGAYRIFGLSAGTYTVRTDPATYPAGYLPTTAPSLSVTLSAGQQYSAADFGLNVGTGQIGDTIWLDADKDGVQDSGETPLPGIGVTLEIKFGSTWYPVATTTTDADGKYLFANLVKGDYRVTVNPNSPVTSPYGGSYTLGSAMTPTYDKDGGTASPNGVTEVTLVSNSSVVTDVDFGYRWAGSIAGTTWYDTDADGNRDETNCSGAPCGAPGSSIVLYLVNADGSYTILDVFETSTGHYDYLFANLPPGNYVVGASEQEVPAPSGSPNAGQVGTMVFTTPDHYAVPLSAGQTVTDKNFGFVEAALLEGTLFHDVNSSAFLDAGEPGLYAILITLTGYDSNGNPVHQTTTTDANGEYRFLVPAGTYTISYNPADVAAAFPGLTLATTPTSLTVSAETGHEVTDLNFGVDNSGVIGDRVWNDADGDGIQDTGEVGLPGVTVNLYQGATLLATTVTDASGAYQFTGLADGTYTVKVDSTTVPAGFTQTYDNYSPTNDHTGQATVSGGGTNLTADFGYHNPTSYSISGNVFNDLGTIGAKDGADVGLSGITVYLYDATGTTVIATTVTDGSGNYIFPGIPNGSYLVKVDTTTLPSRAFVETYESDTSINNAIAVTVAGAPSANNDFGFHAYLGSINGSVCVSVGTGPNVGNGICNSGEPLVENVTITLIGAGPDGLLGTADDTTASTTTNSSGYYEFTNLIPGLYQVVKTNPPNTTGVADYDGGNPDNITVNLAAGQTAGGRDFEVDGGADLAVTKSDGLTTVTSPQNGVVYTIVVVNNGIIPAENVVLNDTVGANLTYVSSDCGMTGSGPYVWTIGTLDVGESRTCHVTVNVASGLSDGTTVTNYANATTTTYEPNITNNEQADIDTVQSTPAPDLQITKTDGQTQVLAGASLAYTINYKNVGNADAANVVIVDTLPANVDYVSSSPSGTYDSGNHTVTWSLGSVAQGADANITLNVTVKNTLLPGAVVLNRVSITTSDTDRNPLDNTAVDSDIVVAPYVVLEKSVSGPAYVGAELTYSIRWENNSSDTANDVVITDVLPDNTSLVAGSITGGGTYDSGTRTITWNLGNQDPGAFGTVSFKVTVLSNVSSSAVNQTAPTLSTESGSGSVTITSTTAARTSLPWCATGDCLTYRGRFLDTNPVPPTGWNDNPRATRFDETGWSQPIAASTAEYFYWMSASDLNAQWTTVNDTGLTYPNYTYFRQMFCLPLNAVPQSASLSLAGDDISTIYLNGILLGQHQGAGSYSTFSGAGALQSGINLLAVQLINNTHNGHPTLGGEDHSGLLFNLQASYSSLRPFAYAPAMTLAGQSVTIQVDENALGGRTPYYYRYDWGDGTITDYTENLTSDSHTYNTPGVYIATVTARAQYGCTGSDQVVITVLPATGKILGNTAHVAYQNTAGKAYSGQSGAGILLSMGAVTGFVYTDVNGDGIYTAGVDSPASGVSVRIVDGYGVEHTGVTGVDGNYTINEVGTGYATVTLVNPPAGVQTQGTNPTTGVLVTAGQTTFEEYNGFYRPTAIGNHVWLDENGNGIQDAGEPGIPNVTVQLWDSTHTTLLATTVTDAEGNYVFKNVPPGTYQVDVLDTSLPTGLVHSAIPGGTGDFTNKADPYSVTIAAGQENVTADFGYNWAPSADVTGNANTGAIGDRVWSDADGDGVQDPGELGLSGVTVELWYDSNDDGIIDALYASTTTDATGHYVFDNLPAGIYIVKVTAGVTGYTQTGDPDGTLDGMTTQPIVLAPGDVYVNADLGYQPGAGMTAAIGDTVWFDANANGAQDAGEPGIAGVTVALIADLNGNGVWDAGEPILATDTTDASGGYQFTGVPVGGNYLVWVNDTAAVLGGLAPSYDSDGTSTPNISAVSALPASGNATQDFGYKPFNQTTGGGLIGDTIFLDRNGNDTADPGEGLEGVTVRLYASDGTTVLATTVTDENGRYAFAGLPAGTYIVKVDTATLPAGLSNTYDPDGGTAHQSTVTLAAGEIVLTQDFGYQGTNSVSGTLWTDTNANGSMDAGETTYFAGVTVALYDSNGNVVATTVTDSSGDYTFDNLPNGTYTVKVTDEANVLDGYWHSLGTANTNNNSQSDPLSVTLTGGTSITYADFGYYRVAASLGDFVWEDDGDGIQETGEPGVAGVRVTLTIVWPGGGTTRLSTLTDANGTYTFGNLLLDEQMDGSGTGEPTFYVSVGIPAGYLPTSTDQGGNDALDSDPHGGIVATVTQGATNNTYDFGLLPRPGAIGDRVWLDANGNGAQDTGEAGIANVKVELYSGASLVATTYTDANGNYLFPNVAPGTYSVKVDSTTLPAGLAANPTYDEDGLDTAHTSAVTLLPGQEYATADFGYNWTPPIASSTGAIGDRIWIDADGDGKQDANEAGLAGVTVELWWDSNSDGTIDALKTSTTTGPDGRYIFDDLAAGAYEVRVTAPGGYTQTGDPDAPGAACTTCDNKTNKIPLTTGQVLVTADFGYKPDVGVGATIGDTIWLDANANATQDAGEPGIPGVTVALIRDTNGNGAWDAGEPIIAATVTDANGQYTFTGIPVADGAGTDDYLVWVNDTANVLSGLAPTYDSNGIGTPNISAVSNLTSAGNDAQDFGYKPAAQTPTGGLIGDTIFLDRDNSGGYTAGEGLEGVIVRLYTDSNADGNYDPGEPLLAQAVTDENGNYYFANLPAGDYVIVVDTTSLPAGLTNTVDPDTSDSPLNESGVTLTAGEIKLDQDFGYQGTNTISGTLWVDTNANGYLDASEAGRLAGVTLALYDANGNVVATATTDNDGNYSFNYLPNGTYTVRVTDQQNVLSGYTHTLGAVNTDSHSQSAPLPVALSGNTSISYADFGYRPPYQPTAITLADFTAAPQGNAILVTWETAAELDNAGFNLYRSETPEGPYTLLNDTLIPPQFPGEVIGGVYTWLDTEVQPGVTYFYKLEDIDRQGVSTFHGPVTVTARAATSAPTFTVFLPLVFRQE